MLLLNQLYCLIILFFFGICVDLKDVNFGIHTTTSNKSTLDRVNRAGGHQSVGYPLLLSYEHALRLIPNFERARVIDSAKVVLSLLMLTVLYTIHRNSFGYRINYSLLFPQRWIIILLRFFG